jgi:hypothetical protein
MAIVPLVKLFQAHISFIKRPVKQARPPLGRGLPLGMRLDRLVAVAERN